MANTARNNGDTEHEEKTHDLLIPLEIVLPQAADQARQDLIKSVTARPK
jgi:hypothetical protein